MIKDKPKYSIIIPLYNRSEELDELLLSFTFQTYKDFEVIVVEDGSELDSEAVVEKYADKLSIIYLKKPNTGPGLSRNFGGQHAKGKVLIFLDSDCVVPPGYMEQVDDFIQMHRPDSFGGPDRFHENFTPIQKAIGFSMSSFYTTGGIRGGNKSMEKFHPRSFNMGFTSEVFTKTGGFSSMRFGEDIDLSIRIKEMGFSSVLIPEAYVYHKRRTDFKKFYKQVFNSGIARINLYKRHPKSLRLVHFLPAGFTTYFFLAIPLCIILLNPVFIFPLVLYLFLLFISSFASQKSLSLALLTVVASIVQLIGYGNGFLIAFWRRIILKQGEFEAYKKNFYK